MSDPQTVKLTEAGRAAKETFQRFVIQATPVRDQDPLGHTRGYLNDAPWFLIDASRAEPEINWPGDLVAEYDDGQAAHDHRWNLVGEAVAATQWRWQPIDTAPINTSIIVSDATRWTLARYVSLSVQQLQLRWPFIKTAHEWCWVFANSGIRMIDFTPTHWLELKLTSPAV